MEKSRECYKKHRLKRLEKDAARDIADPEGYLLMHAKVRAKRAGREFSLSRGDLCIPQRCPVLGIPLVSGRGKKGTAGQSNNSPTVDRIDNGRGYVPGNVVVISWRANSLKGDASMWELQQLVNFYSLFLPCEPSKREEPTDG